MRLYHVLVKVLEVLRPSGILGALKIVCSVLKIAFAARADLEDLFFGVGCEIMTIAQA